MGSTSDRSPDGTNDTDIVQERNIATLQWFVTRARRVEEHSLATDKDRLLAWAQGTITVTQTADKKAMIRQELPEEESLDSLAARCRPFILENDTVHYNKVLKALSYFARRENEQIAAAIKELRSDWRQLDVSSEDPLGYTSRTGKVGSPLGDPVAARALAYAWLYGDLVHADYVPASIGEHDINARFQAGALLVTNIAVKVVATLNLLRVTKEAGLVPIADEVFTETVLARDSYELPLVRFIAAPVDTPLDEIEKFLDKQSFDVRNSEPDS
ncbi:hypothetical protein [Actinomadura sp. NPDC000929]|uniref:hypothetical protein n=1 Tax=Actinomadura sp. NPDC000929 TaxID=3154517 RepID=UPI003399A4B1